jgi:SAM-dependent methyltransferase
MNDDIWLERWTRLMTSRFTNPAILELGCGSGRDTAVLVQQGFRRITATDLSPEALAECARAVPDTRLVCHDLRQPFPFADAGFDVIVASLCLHYFEWQQTVEILRGIHRCLVPGGLLLCRLNSTKDVNHGAVGHQKITHHYYEVDGSPKRFFDADDVDSLFGAEWERISIEEMTIDRYEKPKTVWEIIIRKS